MKGAVLALLVVVACGCAGGGQAAPPTSAAPRATATTATSATSTTAAPVAAATIAAAAPKPDCAGQGVVERTPAPFGPSGAQLASVYLPPCYSADAQRRFPVVYLLHGAGADASQWPAIGLATTADALISTGQIPPLIVVMPDGGVTMPDGLASDLVDQLVPWADSSFRTLADPADRAVGGISRGGRVALLAVASHPGVFAGVGGHSPAVGAADDALAARLSAQPVPVRLDVGANDALRAGVEHFASRIEHAGGSADLVEAPGKHDRVYWRAHAPEYLRYYASLVT